MKSFCAFVVVILVVAASAQDSSVENSGVRLALKIYEDCSKADGLSPCLKKKAITFLDRLARMDKLSLTEGVTVNRAPDAKPAGPSMTEEQIETTLPRAADAKDQALTGMLFDKITNFVGSRTVEVTLPKINPGDLLLVEEGRKKSGGGGGGGKKGGMMGGMMMAIAAKMAALIPIAIAGLFLLAGKALITAKIALLISGIIAIKKLFAQKQGGGGGGGHGGWQSSGGGHGGGGGGGWQSSGGGWDKRSLDVDAQKVAYKAYSPKQ